MLHEALLVANRRAVAEQEKLATDALLRQLPFEVLREIAETGTLKLAFGPCSSDGDGGGSWVSQFKGTPFFQQAIALEQECLQAEMANQQANSVNNQKSQEQYALMDQVRLKKKLLELQKARNEAQVLDGGAGPPAAAGSPDPAGTAPGAPAGPPMEDLKTAAAAMRKMAMDPRLMASLKSTAGAPALKGALTNVGTGASKMQVGQLQSAARKGNNGLSTVAPKPKPVYEAERDPFAKAAAADSKELSTQGKILALVLGGPQAMLGAMKGQRHGEPVEGGLRGAGGFAVGSVPGALIGSGLGQLVGGETGGHIGANVGMLMGGIGGFKILTSKYDHKKHASVAMPVVDGWAREMARDDMAKVAHAKEVFSVGDAAGRMMAKTANAAAASGVGEALIHHFSKHPEHALAAAGALGGVAHGLMKQDGGVTDAIGEGVAGGTAGYAAGSMGKHLLNGHSLGNSAMRTAAGARSDAKKVVGALTPAKDVAEPKAPVADGA